jgi:hypothetical protein
MSGHRWSAVTFAVIAVTGCYPATTRPGFVPVPEAATREVELSITEATQQLAIALDAERVPVRRTEPRDGWLETDWFDVKTLKPTSARRLGDQVVKIRAWVDPSKPNYSLITVEPVYRPFADPSRDDRSLEHLVPNDHPVAMRVFRILDSLARKYTSVKN